MLVVSEGCYIDGSRGGSIVGSGFHDEGVDGDVSEGYWFGGLVCMRCGVKDCGMGSVRVAVIIDVVINGGYGSISMVLILVVVMISARVVMVVFCFVLVCRLRSGLEARVGVGG